MATLTDKIENALNETRILVLGMQILIGFSYRSFFEPGFDKMAHYDQQLQLIALGLMLLGLGLLLVPAPYHRIVLHGRNTGELQRLATATVSIGLLPFALALALSMFLGAHWVGGRAAAAIFAAIILVVALFFWYGLELAGRRRKEGALHLPALIDPLRGNNLNEEEETNLTTRIKQVFIECRVVLPGAQALLGFQLIIMWMTAFRRIPHLWQLLHLASLTATTVCTVLLMAPAAYHRIVNRGDDSEELHHFTSLMLLAAMVFLGFGVAGDFYVVSRVTGLSAIFSASLAIGLLLFFYGAWFGYSEWRKHQLPARQTESHLAGQRAA